MKKALIVLGTVLALASTHVAFAACTPVSSTFPSSLDTFVANDCIPSSWANTLESTIGTTTVTTSIIQRIVSLASTTATTTITASGTTLTSPFTFASSTTILPFASGSQLYFALVNSGNWAGTWQGVNSSTFYLASNPSNYLTGNQAITLNGAVSGIGATTITTAYNTSTLFGFFSANGTGLTYNTSTGAFSWTNTPGYITTSSISINGTAGNVFTGLSTSTGVSAGSCTNCNLTVNANGEVTTLSNGSGGSGGSLSTSSAITANEFPSWSNTMGALTGTSTIFYSTSTGDISINTSTDNGMFSIATKATTTNAMTVDTDGDVFFGSATDTTQSGGVSSTVSFVNPASNTRDSYVDFRNLSNGNGEYFLINASSAYENIRVEDGSYLEQWDLGMFGTTNFGIMDDAAGTTPFAIQKSAPSNSLLILSSGAIGFGTSTPAGFMQLSSSTPTGTTNALLTLGKNPIENGNASGTVLGTNQPSGYNGDLMNLQVNSTTIFKVTSSTIITNNNLLDAGGNPYVTSSAASALGFAFTTTGGVTDCGTSSLYAVVASTTITTAAHTLFLDGGVSIQGPNNDQMTMNVRLYVDGTAVGQTVTTDVSVPSTGTFYYQSEVSYVGSTTAATHTVALECNTASITTGYQTPYLSAKEMY